METLCGPISITDILRANNNWRRYIAWNKGCVRFAVFRSVHRALACRTPLLGYHLFRCANCDTTRVIPHSCKSPFCSSCGVARTNKWCAELLDDILPVHYRHLVFTIPWELRLLIQDNRDVLLSAMFQSAAYAVMALTGGTHEPLGKAAQERQKAMDPRRKFVPGIIAIVHTFGDDLKWNPHIHLIVTAGGLNPVTSRWVDAPKRSLVSAVELAVEWKLRLMRAVKEAEERGGLHHRRLRCDRRRRLNVGKLLGV